MSDVVSQMSDILCWMLDGTDELLYKAELFPSQSLAWLHK